MGFSKRFLGFALGLAIVLAPFVVWWQWHAIYDWYRLRNYSPPAAVISLASQDTMTSYGKHLFYINQPQIIQSVSGFSQSCSENEQTIVLGCYHPGEAGIFIYDV